MICALVALGRTLLPLPLSLGGEGWGEGVENIGSSKSKSLPAGVGISVQHAELSLVPPESLPLGGYTARGNKTFLPGGDDLKCRVTVLTQDGRRVMIASCEMLTIPESLYKAVCDRLKEPGMLFLSATHTHCAPDSQMLNDRMTFAIPGIASYKKRWLEWYADRIATAINEATQAPKKQMREWKVAMSVLRMNRGRRQGAVASPLFQALYADGKVVAVNYSAHAVNFDSDTLTLQSDWPGKLMRATGALAFPGSLGDVSPNFGAGTPAEKISRFVDAAQQKLSQPDMTSVLDSSLAIGGQSFETTAPKPHPTFAKKYGISEAIAQILVGKFAPRQLTFSWFRIGKLAVVGIPGEPTADLGRRMQLVARNHGYRDVWVIGHVNGWGGYMLEPWDYDRGGYEAELSFYGREESKMLLNDLDRALSVAP